MKAVLAAVENATTSAIGRLNCLIMIIPDSNWGKIIRM
jgi:hypothetical protein